MKAKLRKEILGIRDALSEETVESNSAIIFETLKSTKEFIDASSIFIYCSTFNEIKTDEIIREALPNKIVHIPTILQEKLYISKLKCLSNLKLGAFNIREPNEVTLSNPEEIDLFIVPGVAFDTKLNRLGHGYGFFDKLLENTTAPIIALAHDFQIQDDIPHNSKDVKMHKIITEKRTIS